ncbi:uncharacterized protein Dvir_GJ26839 [Drosophila virilis]|uniref:Uncharacterized protein n=1 Tax=Drosophila virilis TaxID=7244 RepID=A0A0Q9W7P2_DROVI|nr:uncharacterized protein Dvir_GJ26839 [Drosophila virilis]
MSPSQSLSQLASPLQFASQLESALMQQLVASWRTHTQPTQTQQNVSLSRETQKKKKKTPKKKQKAKDPKLEPKLTKKVDYGSSTRREHE